MRCLGHKIRVFIICTIIILFANATAFTQEQTTTVTTQKTPFWRSGFNLSIGLKGSINPCWLSGSFDGVNLSQALHVGFEITPSYSVVGIILGYQYMGVGSIADKTEYTYYFGGSTLYAGATQQEHLAYIIPVFMLPRGIYRPYFGAGVAFTFTVLSYSHGIEKSGRDWGLNIKNETFKVSYGAAFQGGINFHFLKHFGMGVGVELLIHDWELLLKKEPGSERLEELAESTYLNLKIMYSIR